MRRVVIYKNSALAWLFSSVLNNTISTIIFAAIIAGAIPFALMYASSVFNYGIWFWVLIGALIFGAYIIFKTFAYEKILYKNDFRKNGLTKWKNNELRPLGVSRITDGALFLQFFDIPLTLDQKFDTDYAFEFKAKVITDVFSWTLSSEIDQSNIESYMFQYSPFNKTLRPHFLIDYDLSQQQSVWLTPERDRNLLRTIDNLELKTRYGWFHIRTEVRRQDKTGTEDVSAKGIEVLIRRSDGSATPIKYNSENFNKVLEIRIYDMNNFNREVFHVMYTEPPFPFLGSEYVGFRNAGIESSLYKDIRIYQI